MRESITKRQRRVAKLIPLVLLPALAIFAFLHAGTWLIVQDPLEQAQCAIVFGGKTPFRAMEAAKIYHDGWTREIWLTERGLSAADIALTKVGVVQTPEHVYNRQVLERLGVPKSAISLIKGSNNN